MTTVVLLNPYGTDVTNFVNRTAGVAQLLNGGMSAPGDTIYTLPYDYHTSSAANITTAVGMLDTKLRSLHAAGEYIKVRGYSQGCQIIDQWISENAATPPIPANAMDVLCIGNADRKFGGFAYGKSSFNTVAYTGGLPSSVPWQYIDFARQYDPIADYPQSVPLNELLSSVELTLTNIDAIGSAVGALATLATNTAEMACTTNLVAGLLLIHTGLGMAGSGYMSVTPNPGGAGSDSQRQLWHTDSNGVQYGIEVTYPVPSLGLSTWFPSLDIKARAEIEQSYSRIFGVMPTPPQDVTTAAQVNPVTAVIPPQGVLAQVAAILSHLSLSNVQDYRFTSAQDQLALVMGEWRSNQIQASIDLLKLWTQLAAIQASYPHDGGVAQAIEYVTSVM